MRANKAELEASWLLWGKIPQQTPHITHNTKHEFVSYVRPTMSSFQRHESQRAMNLQRPPISPNSPSYRLHHTNTKQHYSKSKNTQANKRFSVTPGGTP